MLHTKLPQYFASNRLPIGALLLLCSCLVFPAAVGAQDNAKPTRPNILFAIADDWGYNHASAYGSSWVNTPAFDRVAREGILFQHAYTPNAKCAPSRACLLTGRNSWQLKEAANHIPFFPAEYKTFAETLGDHGYFVGHTGKGWGPGIANDAQGQPRQMTGRAFNEHKTEPPTRAISNNDYAANFGDFLQAAPEDRPWCFWYGALEPHRGYQFGSGVAQAGKELSDIDHVPAYWPDNQTVRNDMLDYAFEVEHFDRHLGRMLEQLDQRGLLRNTLVVVTSDHGMPFPRCKGQAYDDSNHVPLAIRWPAGIQQPGREVDDYVSFVDVAPTFIEVAGLAWNDTGMASTPGRSLTDIFNSPKSGRVNPERDHVLIGKERHDIGRPHDWGYPIRGIVKEGMLYIQNFEPTRWPAGNPETGYLNTDGGATKTEVLQLRRSGQSDRFWQLCFGKRPAEELYEIASDPDCVNNLAESSEHQQVKQRLQEQMSAELHSQEDPRMFGRGAVFDEYTYANEDTRNFYERYTTGERIRAGWVNPDDFEKEPVAEK